MIKVLQVINSLEIGGAEKLVTELIPFLNSKGVKCELLLLDGKETFFLQELAEKSETRIISLKNTRNIYNPLIIFKLQKHLLNYDIIHAHLFPSQYWIAIAKSLFFLNPTLVTTEHSPENPRRKILLFRLLERYIYKKYKTIIAVSAIAEENLKIHLNSYGSKIQLIENGVDISAISRAIPYSKEEILPGCKEDNKLILNVARFSRAKDHSTLIKAMTYLPETIHLLLVGDGELKLDFVKMVNELNLEKRVHFLGLRQDIYRIIKSVDINVMSSFYEGLSLSSIEAMASGKPFLASDVKGLREITKDAGLLFEQGNPHDLAVKINLLLEDKYLFANTAANCLIRASKYDIERTADSYIRIYQSVALKSS